MKPAKNFKIPPIICRACLGSGGYQIIDYVDDDDRYYPHAWILCMCCEGAGTNCARCHPKNK